MDENILKNGLTDEYLFKVFSVKCGYEYSVYRGAGKDESFYNYDSDYNRVYFKNKIITEQELPLLSLYLPKSITNYDHSFAYAKAEGFAYENVNYNESISSSISFSIGLKIIKSSFFEKVNEELKVDVFKILQDLYERQGGVKSYYKTFTDFFTKLKTQDYLGGNRYHQEILAEETLKLLPKLSFEIIDVNNLEILSKIIEFVKTFNQVNPNTIEANLKASKIMIAKDFDNNIIATAVIKPIKNRLDYVKSVINNSQFVEEIINGYTFKRDNEFDGELGYCNVADNYRGIGIIDYMIKVLINKDRIFATTGNPAMSRIMSRHGFCKVGQNWEGIYNPSLGLYIFNYGFYEKKFLNNKKNK